MNHASKPKRKGRPSSIALLYLTLSATVSSFWTWIIRLILAGLPLWGSIIIFLILFLCIFMVLACIAVGAKADTSELTFPTLQEDTP